MPKVDWSQLLREAENGHEKNFTGTVDITVAEELAFGFYLEPAEIVIVKDTEGRIWVLNETHEDDSDLRGLVSRYNIQNGMQFRLKVLPEETKVFCITPERKKLHAVL